MGNYITRNRRRRRAAIQDSMDERNDLNNEHAPDNNESLLNRDHEPDLASILSFLLRSGQVRLIRSGGLGPFEVSVSHWRGEGVLNSSDDSDDEPWRHPHHARTPPASIGDFQPDTTNMNTSVLQSIVQNDAGLFLKNPKNITTRLLQRESYLMKGRDHFVSADQTHFSQSFLPNYCETVARYRSKAFCGSYSSDGTVFMSACQDQHIRLYDTTDGKFKLFRDIIAKDVGWSIVDTTYSPDQHYIIYSSWSEFVHLCNVYGDHNTHLALDLRPVESRFCAFSVSFSQDSREIIAGGSDRGIYIYDRESDNRILRIQAHDDDVNAVTFADSSSRILVSGGDDGICKVWDRRTLSEDNPKAVGMFAGHTDGITYVCSKGDGTHFISNSKDQTIKLWDTRKFSSQETIREARRIVANQNWDYRWETVPRRSQRLQMISGNDSIMTYRGHSVLHTLLRAKFSPLYTGQQYIYTGCATGSVVIYDVLTGNIVTKLKGAHRQCVRDVSWHPYENIIMSSSWDFTVGKWEYCRMACDDFQCDSIAHTLCYQDNRKGSKRKRMRSEFIFD